MNLSPNFKYDEFIQSDTAKRLGIPNEPPDSALPMARALCEKMLEPIRAKWGPLRITSGYRSPALNIEIGGAATSDHCWDDLSAAADVQPINAGMKEVFDWLRLESGLPFDQILLEHKDDVDRPRCIHIGYRENPRRMAGITTTQSRGKVKEWLVVV